VGAARAGRDVVAHLSANPFRFVDKKVRQEAS